MQRYLAGALAAGVLLALAPPQPARAGATVDLLFVGINGTPIAPSPSVTLHRTAGDELTMAVRLTSDEALTVAAFSLEFDPSDAELEVMSAFQWNGVAIGRKGERFAPIIPLCAEGRLLFCAEKRIEGVPSYLGWFQGAVNLHAVAHGVALPPGSYQMGTVTWRTTDVKTDGDDILSGLFVTGVDGFGDASYRLIDQAIRFNSASVHMNPEPGTAFLLGLGFAGLAIARRFRR